MVMLTCRQVSAVTVSLYSSLEDTDCARVRMSGGILWEVNLKLLSAGLHLLGDVILHLADCSLLHFLPLTLHQHQRQHQYQHQYKCINIRVAFVVNVNYAHANPLAYPIHWTTHITLLSNHASGQGLMVST